jgi:hypothetical protein
MTELVPTGGGQAVAIPAAAPAPTLPPLVASYLRDVEVYADQRAAWAKAEEAARFRRSGDPDPREQVFVGKPPALPALDEAGRAVAKAALEAYDAALLTLTPELLTAWLLPLARVVRNRPSGQDLVAMVRQLVEVLDDLPAGAFTAETRRRLEGDWFPSAGEIRRAVEPEAARLRDMAKLLREVSRPPVAPRPALPIEPPPDDRPPPPDIAALAARAFAAAPAGEDQGPARIAGDRPKVKPYYATGDALRALREAAKRGGGR